MAQEANALGNARDMPTWAGAQEGMGFHNAKAFPKDTPALAFRCKCRDDVDGWDFHPLGNIDQFLRGFFSFLYSRGLGFISTRLTWVRPFAEMFNCPN